MFAGAQKCEALVSLWSNKTYQKFVAYLESEVRHFKQIHKLSDLFILLVPINFFKVRNKKVDAQKFLPIFGLGLCIRYDYEVGAGSSDLGLSCKVANQIWLG